MHITYRSTESFPSLSSFSLDQSQYLSDCLPSLTPPQTQQQLTDNNLGLLLGKGEGSVHSCQDTDVDPSSLIINFHDFHVPTLVFIAFLSQTSQS